jgi:uncharacterized protein
VEVAFTAHAEQAWEFDENQFFQTSGTGGTVSSTIFALGREIVRERFDPACYNIYFFYASDGENLVQDRQPALDTLRELSGCLNYGGFIELSSIFSPLRSTEMAAVFAALRKEALPLGTARVTGIDGVWEALRAFFRDHSSPANVA